MLFFYRSGRRSSAKRFRDGISHSIGRISVKLYTKWNCLNPVVVNNRVSIFPQGCIKDKVPIQFLDPYRVLKHFFQKGFRA